jgi:hypothetical protein
MSPHELVTAISLLIHAVGGSASSSLSVIISRVSSEEFLEPFFMVIPAVLTELFLWVCSVTVGTATSFQIVSSDAIIISKLIYLDCSMTRLTNSKSFDET